MSEITNALGHIVSQNLAWAGPIVGLLTFGESLVVIGALVPATVLLLLVGGLIATGAVDACMVIAWALAGAVAGDAASFALGRRLGTRALRHRLLIKHRRLIARTRLFTRRHGVAAIYLGRFAGPFRAFVPLMAGVNRMPARSFHLANLLSGALWVTAFLAPGYIAVRGVGLVDRNVLIARAVVASWGLAFALLLPRTTATRKAQAAWSSISRWGAAISAPNLAKCFLSAAPFLKGVIRQVTAIKQIIPVKKGAPSWAPGNP